MINWYLANKAAGSRDRYTRERPPRATLPREALTNPEALAWWIAANVKYTGDGPRVTWSAAMGRWIGCGFPDIYTHPEAVVYQARYGDPLSIECDCDDVALVAYQGLLQMHYEGRDLPVSAPKLLTLVAGSIQWQWAFPWAYWPSHVVCVFERADGQTGQMRTGIIDTNGLHWADSLADAVAMVGRWYQTTYTAHETAFPF